MRYLKTYKLLNVSVGDYVYCENGNITETPTLDSFLKDNIGQIIEIDLKKSEAYKIEYHNIPPECLNYFCDVQNNSGTRSIRWTNIVAWDKDPELLKAKIVSKKFSI